MTRTCRRNGCAQPATATLTFRYDTAQAWLSDLAREVEPQCWDLCPAHAGKLTVPVGWELVDARSDAGTIERSAVDAGGSGSSRLEATSAARAATSGESAGAVSVASARRGGGSARQARGARPNRYAELSARLPELAARMTASSPLLRESDPEADAE